MRGGGDSFAAPPRPGTCISVGKLRHCRGLAYGSSAGDRGAAAARYADRPRGSRRRRVPVRGSSEGIAALPQPSTWIVRGLDTATTRIVRWTRRVRALSPLDAARPAGVKSAEMLLLDHERGTFGCYPVKDCCGPELAGPRAAVLLREDVSVVGREVVSVVG